MMTELTYRSSAELPSTDVLEGIVHCMNQFMRSSPVERWQNKLADRESSFVQWVLDGDRIIAFKVGYELRPGLFYSWLGGVHPAYRRSGIATKLMAEQHAYARSIGCSEIRTITTNEHKSMMICNLKQGFNIVETKDRDGELRIVMAMNLQKAAK